MFSNEKTAQVSSIYMHIHKWEAGKGLLVDKDEPKKSALSDDPSY